MMDMTGRNGADFAEGSAERFDFDHAHFDRSHGSLADRAFLQERINAASSALLSHQREDGHWCFEFEADATIPAEYALLVHYLGEEPNLEREAKIATYLRRIQGEHGGWPLFHKGEFDMSASVKAYFALKMIGDDIDAPHMVRAREAILSRGGAEMANVFTRILLALFGVVTWRAVPVMPVEIMHLPRWFPFHMSKVSYWARTVMVPLFVLGALKPVAKNPRRVSVDELFHTNPKKVGPRPRAEGQSRAWYTFFAGVDACLRVVDPMLPKRSRKSAIGKAVTFVKERLNGEDGLGAIFPAMANSVMMYEALGVPENDPDRAIARYSIEKLLFETENEVYCQPCVSPVWDTGLAAHALLETGGEAEREAAQRGLEWLKPLQVLDVKGDWADQKPDVRPGGWAFQYANPHYPDVDDTAVVALALDRAAHLPGSHADSEQSVARAKEWVSGLQSKNGGWGAFDADNTCYYLNNIPFSDHGALLDPPTVDVSARCVSMLAQLGEKPDTNATMKRGIDYILSEQEKDGSWFGRWGSNYIYGTWSALCALNAAGVAHESAAMRRAVAWLVSIQNEDGGWGEDGSSYKLDYKGYEKSPSTASQTSWALLGLMAAGEVDNPAVKRGIAWLVANQNEAGTWKEERHNAPGFPRVFYLIYHGYSKYFPLWALARYRNLTSGNRAPVMHGM
ncbi:squalene-hopene cyclase [Rhodomicrobium vannielii ATCC 17100]|uniref:Squalene-hopene cyclase n=1 Tax=Rhodomicrobium vannielii (strain ATCC 17100 / DSM 162 / LMG 4299 / NCIMB 10020 / ATH 3.1.1) TaxID=648757 RepID=E3I0A3_RHOVT|nr:squalene-hopene cyclase [Rhodomicrobium vannielii ATCC 17100]